MELSRRQPRLQNMLQCMECFIGVSLPGQSTVFPRFHSPICYGIVSVQFCDCLQHARAFIGAKAAKGIIGKVIDILFMFGLIGGVGTSMGLGTPMLSAGIAELFNVDRTFILDVIVVIIWAMIFGMSVYSGLEKGIKRLSDVNLILIIVVLGFTFLFGPTVFYDQYVYQ